jgi:flagellar biosynthesis/type III secretory pathway chaperone
MLPRLNLVLAHKLEAAPLIDHFGLQQRSVNPLVYAQEEGMQLIVGGEGVPAARAAVKHLAAGQGESAQPGWLNIGIAGHQSRDIGNALLANKIVHRASGECHYPVPLFPGFDAGELHTVDKPEYDYPEDVAYDMEAAGFYAEATQYTTIELVQCFKIVSDNKARNADLVSLKSVKKLLADKLQTIHQLVEAMLHLQSSYADFTAVPEQLQQLLARVHLTATQQVQVKRLLQRYRAFGLQEQLDDLLQVNGINGRELVQQMESTLRAAGA